MVRVFRANVVMKKVIVKVRHDARGKVNVLFIVKAH